MGHAAFVGAEGRGRLELTGHGVDYSRTRWTGMPCSGDDLRHRPAFVTLINSLRTGLDVRQSLRRRTTIRTAPTTGSPAGSSTRAEAFDFVSLTSYRDNDYSWRDNLGGLPFRSFPLAVDDEATEGGQAVQPGVPAGVQDRIRSSTGWPASTSSTRRWTRSERFVVGAALPIAPPSFGGDVTFLQDATNRSYAAFGQARPFRSPTSGN